jgi:pimeloyl-ACP methyl ester carboxylesterase
MSALELTATTLAGGPGRPLLLVGHSLGTSGETLWGACAARLGDRFHVVGWDLPGHGRSAPAAVSFGVAGLARAVLDLVERIRPGEPWVYAGASIGGDRRAGHRDVRHLARRPPRPPRNSAAVGERPPARTGATLRARRRSSAQQKHGAAAQKDSVETVSRRTFPSDGVVCLRMQSSAVGRSVRCPIGGSVR